MPMPIGTELSQARLVRNLLELESVAIAIYDSALERLSAAEELSALADFRQDHVRHVQELTEMAARLRINNVPKHGSAPTQSFSGLEMNELESLPQLMRALKTNEENTGIAYRKAAANPLSDLDMTRIFHAAAHDEEQHQEWMEAHSQG
ncbi:ferritin-like domain-containing protein [Histidinibacterium aquaticum]|uniref:Ferritin-like domain-containing protein n=1 Tax=Histidinibacterium aquaticum TaxID=2613962 RepID=A0A5J5GF46_9RHOB|nr:ferritin-like domain-containing protein [Histidinibacterium aquaticum]KAA9006647.1 ferritin-like domain-containing protein [Histidinibacterium aquaticum]